MKESKIYTCKQLKIRIFNIIKVIFVCSQKKFYHKNTIGIWYRKSYGLGLVGKPNKQIKYFMIGISLFNINIWLDFHYIGNSINKKQPLKIKL